MKKHILGLIVLIAVSLVTAFTIQACGSAAGGNVTFKSAGQ
jgi:hypothetical protein